MCRSIRSTRRYRVESNTDFNQAIVLDPGEPTWRWCRAIVAAREGRPDLALVDLKQGLESRPKNASAYAYRASLYRHQGKPAEAMEDFRRAVELNPRLWECYNGRGWVHMEQGDRSAALRDFDRAVTANPDAHEAYYQSCHSPHRPVRLAACFGGCSTGDPPSAV